VLAAATVLSVIVSIVLQFRNSKREDRLRREDATNAENARREQYAHTEDVRRRDIERAQAEQEARHAASRAQMIQILSAYERVMGLLAAAPQADISAQMETAKILFERALSSDLGEAIEPTLRPQIYLAVVKAQDTLNSTVAHQRYRNEALDKLDNEHRDALQYAADLRYATSRARQSGSQDLQDQLVRLRESPAAQAAAMHERTFRERTANLDQFYRAIKDNVASAATALKDARYVLGDNTEIVAPA
jgi:hypothetical protein